MGVQLKAAVLLVVLACYVIILEGHSYVVSRRFSSLRSEAG
jgi:hypothetical protein